MPFPQSLFTDLEERGALHQAREAAPAAFAARLPEVPDTVRRAVSQAEDRVPQALERVQEAIAGYLKTLAKQGEPDPAA